MIRGRGTDSQIPGRFTAYDTEAVHDGWPETPAAEATDPATICEAETAGKIISRNGSPDVPFEQSINSYRGCEHGCIYCFARPNHAYADRSPGIDFETRITAKVNAADRLRAELAHPRYHCRPIVLGTSTDPYQPLERDWRITRSLLEVLAECRHPVSVITKGAGVLRDQDLLADMAADGLVSVAVSLTSLDPDLKRRLEPRAAGPQRRLRVIETLAGRGIPVGTLVAPVIPALTDHELERLVAAAATAGAEYAGYVLLRLPWEVRPLFREWLDEHQPGRAEHVMSLLRQARGGRENDPCFGTRMRGTGAWADLLEQRFRKALRANGLERRQSRPLNTTLFQPPRRSPQLSLFD